MPVPALATGKDTRKGTLATTPHSTSVIGVLFYFADSLWISSYLVSH